MGSCSMVIPKNLCEDPRELLEFVGLPSESERATKQLSGSMSELVRAVVAIVDGMILRAMEERTAAGFIKVRGEVFPQYFAAMTALGMMIKATVPQKDINWIMAQSLSELESDFRDSGAATFGQELRDRGIFTVWILRKIHDMGEELEKAFLIDQKTDKDAEKNLKHFATYAIWSRFHIDCLVKSMRSRKPIFPDVVDSIEDGMRGVVNAYAWIRQEVDRRTGAVEPTLMPIPWDAEDEMLLADSIHDLDNEKP